MARKKYGANKIKCKKYRDYGMREKNKARKLRRHLKTHETDQVAIKALKGLQ